MQSKRKTGNLTLSRVSCFHMSKALHIDLDEVPESDTEFDAMSMHGRSNF